MSITGDTTPRGATRWADCVAQAHELAEQDESGTVHGLPDHARGRQLAALLFYCSPDVPDGEIDTELRHLVTAAADVPAGVLWPDNTHHNLAQLERLRAELARRLRTVGHELADDDLGPRDESMPLRVWRWLHLTPATQFEPPYDREPWNMLTESTWYMPGRAPLGEGVLRVHQWLNPPPATSVDA